MGQQISIRNLFYIGLIIVLILFLFWQRAVLTPFIFAMVFAYVFNPLINYFSEKMKIPRVVSILFVYLLLIISAITSTILFSRLITNESAHIAKNFASFTGSLKSEVKVLPSWAQPYVRDYINDVSGKQFIETENFLTVPSFTKVFSGFISFFTFLFAAFFFLKDYRKMTDIFLDSWPLESRDKVKKLLLDINTILSRYLRGQIVLILSMSIMLFALLSLIGAKYALTIAIVSSLFEIVPFIGPIAAAIFGTSVIIISGGATFLPVNLLEAAVITLGIYYVTRLLQDYLILPVIIGNATRLHPLIVLFSVLVGERVYGVLGIILAVPLVATLKIIYEFVVAEYIRQ